MYHEANTCNLLLSTTHTNMFYYYRCLQRNMYKSRNEVTLYFTLYCECIIKPVPNYFTKLFMSS